MLSKSEKFVQIENNESISPSDNGGIRVIEALVGLLLLMLMFGAGSTLQAQPTVQQKIEGMLIGSFIGDAAGGPMEFHDIKRIPLVKTGRTLNAADLDSLAAMFRLQPYTDDAEPYAQWVDQAPAGSVTDDSRYKLLLLLSVMEAEKLDPKTFRRIVLDYYEAEDEPYPELRREWLEQYAMLLRWQLGDTTSGPALPPERIWGGISTMAGQMPLPVVAAFYPGKPEQAYLKAWEMDFLDVSYGKDMNCALVAGLAAALQPGASWDTVYRAMRETDPYQFGEVPWVSRKFTDWLDRAMDWAKEAEGKPQRLFDRLESDLEANTWWEAWVPYVVSFSILELADRRPLASMELVLQFGHDTDSYAQILGAFLGAIHGPDIFPDEMQELVKKRLEEQYDIQFVDLLQVIYEVGKPGNL